MGNSNRNTIGIGWSFPPTFDLLNKTVLTVEGVTDIQQSLSILFGTKPGERILLQEYGCDINVALFQNISLTEQTILENNIKQAIINYEPRIDLNKVAIDGSRLVDGILYIQIDFTVRTTNSRHNMVFPYYVEEGTLISLDL